MCLALSINKFSFGARRRWRLQNCFRGFPAFSGYMGAGPWPWAKALAQGPGPGPLGPVPMSPWALNAHGPWALNAHGFDLVYIYIYIYILQVLISFQCLSDGILTKVDS